MKKSFYESKMINRGSEEQVYEDNQQEQNYQDHVEEEDE